MNTDKGNSNDQYQPNIGQEYVGLVTCGHYRVNSESPIQQNVANWFGKFI